MPQLKPIEQHLIPASAAERSLDVLNEFGVDIWLFTNDAVADPQPATANTSRTKSARSRPIRPWSTDFTPYLPRRLQDRRRQPGSGAAGALRSRDAGGGRRAGDRGPLAELLSRRHPAGPRQGHLRAGDGAAARHLRPTRSPPSATWRTTLPMFGTSGMSVAMGNAADDVKKQATACHRRRTRTTGLRARSRSC